MKNKEGSISLAEEETDWLEEAQKKSSNDKWMSVNIGKIIHQEATNYRQSFEGGTGMLDAIKELSFSAWEKVVDNQDSSEHRPA